MLFLLQVQRHLGVDKKQSEHDLWHPLRKAIRWLPYNFRINPEGTPCLGEEGRFGFCRWFE